MYDNIVGWAATVDWQAWAMFAQAGAILFAAWIAKQTVTKALAENLAKKRAETAIALLETTSRLVTAYEVLTEYIPRTTETIAADIEKEIPRRKDILKPIFSEAEEMRARAEIFQDHQILSDLRDLISIRKEILNDFGLAIAMETPTLRDAEGKVMFALKKELDGQVQAAKSIQTKIRVSLQRYVQGRL